MSSTIGDDFRQVVQFGNIVVLKFELRRFGSKMPLDVSLASQITLELETPDQVPFGSINAQPNAPGADWDVGLVYVTIGPANVTGIEGTWIVGLTVFLAGEEKTYRTGTVEVQRRPGYGA